MKWINFLFIVLVFSSCWRVKKDDTAKLIKEWNGKEIFFPNNLVFTLYGKDTLQSLPQSDYTIITYVDSIGCSCCKLKLQNWFLLKDDLRNIASVNVSVLFVLHPKDKKEIMYTLLENRFEYPICVDDADLFNKKNRFPTDIMLQTFLLDKNNKVLAIGNPVYNPKVKQLYLDIISGKPVGQKTQEVLTEITVSTKQLDFGSFDWQQAQTKMFSLQNTGKYPLVVQDITTSCGCTSVEYSKEPVQPGESLEMKVTYKADHAEHFNKTITVYCNAAVSPLQFKIVGNAK